MAVRIRMKRLGRRHRPFYRICVMDARVPRDGKAIEEIGTYDPMVREKSERVQLNMERVEHWLSVGAQPSEKVAVLIRKVRDNKWGEAKPLPPMTMWPSSVRAVWSDPATGFNWEDTRTGSSSRGSPVPNRGSWHFRRQGLPGMPARSS